ncbi:uncharacterized protein LOC125610353 isoform X1 [Marmota marmota marmota]|uniref:uncharacterized protein LOC125610353 isoform X1 n=1 Tax=Marmota marmota marmota TaxID=9994 RepID=UPI002093BFB5|nr:uncharacterized protein LOC125610353 isoform X1 [Marmota marmota marmota]
MCSGLCIIKLLPEEPRETSSSPRLGAGKVGEQRPHPSARGAGDTAQDPLLGASRALAAGAALGQRAPLKRPQRRAGKSWARAPQGAGGRRPLSLGRPICRPARRAGAQPETRGWVGRGRRERAAEPCGARAEQRLPGTRVRAEVVARASGPAQRGGRRRAPEPGRQRVYPRATVISLPCTSSKLFFPQASSPLQENWSLSMPAPFLFPFWGLLGIVFHHVLNTAQDWNLRLLVSRGFDWPKLEKSTRSQKDLCDKGACAAALKELNWQLLPVVSMLAEDCLPGLGCRPFF